jgi:hypothetical protein
MMIKQTIMKTALFSLVLGGSALPVFADNHKAIQWQQLPMETREILAPMENRWDTLEPRRQHILIRKAQSKEFKNRADRWNQLTPEQRERIVKARQRFKEMPPEKRKELRKRWENMTDEEKRKVRERRLDKPQRDDRQTQGKDKLRDNKKQK